MTKRLKILLLCGLILACGLTGCTQGQEDDAKEPEVEEVKENRPLLGIVFELPEAFTQDETQPGRYVTESYPQDISCIWYEERIADERINLLDEDSIREQTQEMYLTYYGIDTKVEVVDFHRFKRDNLQGLRIETVFEVQEQMVQKIEYVILAESKTYSLTFMQPLDGPWLKEFEACAITIALR